MLECQDGCTARPDDSRELYDSERIVLDEIEHTLANNGIKEVIPKWQGFNSPDGEVKTGHLVEAFLADRNHLCGYVDAVNLTPLLAEPIDHHSGATSDIEDAPSRLIEKVTDAFHMHAKRVGQGGGTFVSGCICSRQLIEMSNDDTLV